ncbi:cytochrome c oxidase subunit II [Stackebrandtia nassauensis]|uniref:cytochrome-c oxidase n=1 Tax=Stackebrandtia nassauensis (strain DSM 44728 / CIP 108903 / NRRL B-16338 / NBRC 102104 / LLR-40K-21) TaxID=446470 RepID=D3Q129_STANL|nr:cytochrome c oxidase subunit II [Stackebrandtia nassauensis]ADD43779.1 cytochrome c oxidase, subunit II [Stackebrandtia nassauensis DSM 44728]
MSLPLLAGCSVDEAFAFGWPRKLPTPESREMFNMWIGSTIAALAVGVFVWGLIFWCVIRYRKKSDELPVQTRYNLPMELLFTVTPFLIIAVLFYYTVIVQSNVTKLTENPDTEVTVTAFKWNWEFSYPEAEGKDGKPVSTVGDSDYVPVLVVPTNERIRFTEVSEDVIHSFWVPDLLFKRDVMPGYENKFEVTIEEEGAYVGRCAELCGAYHSMMNFEMRAVSGEDYKKFLKQLQAGKSTPEALEAIGEDPYATTTKPFDTKPNSRKAS